MDITVNAGFSTLYIRKDRYNDLVLTVCEPEYCSEIFLNKKEAAIILDFLTKAYREENVSK